MKTINCDEAKALDMVLYLSLLGHEPQRVRHPAYWFCSPFRQEKTASFKVDRIKNLWYDHGTGKGGDLINFGITYYNCTVSQLLQKLTTQVNDFSFHQHQNKAILPAEKSFLSEAENSTDSRILILKTRPIQQPDLIRYAAERYISLAVCGRYCKEVDFQLYGRKNTAIGFPNNAGGYELRNAHFKGSSSPKDISFIDEGATSLTVFEGFFNYLSLLEINASKTLPLTNFLVLNSLAFLERAKPLMDKHAQVFLYLDNDNSGIKATQQLVVNDNKKYKDLSAVYDGLKDLNEWLKRQPPRLKKGLGVRRSF
ncbi:toprim domain-containing protein [Mucilaginibacter defluvii]|uniref:Toprim domain-containing protein n=2 Tax=Mucilaginibacter defluvii TaxID=1196019 RepID=A0ABP9G729_9SPHI